MGRNQVSSHSRPSGVSSSPSPNPLTVLRVLSEAVCASAGPECVLAEHPSSGRSPIYVPAILVYAISQPVRPQAKLCAIFPSFPPSDSQACTCRTRFWRWACWIREHVRFQYRNVFQISVAVPKLPTDVTLLTTHLGHEWQPFPQLCQVSASTKFVSVNPMGEKLSSGHSNLHFSCDEWGRALSRRVELCFILRVSCLLTRFASVAIRLLIFLID